MSRIDVDRDKTCHAVRKNLERSDISPLCLGFVTSLASPFCTNFGNKVSGSVANDHSWWKRMPFFVFAHSMNDTICFALFFQIQRGLERRECFGSGQRAFFGVCRMRLSWSQNRQKCGQSEGAVPVFRSGSFFCLIRKKEASQRSF